MSSFQLMRDGNEFDINITLELGSSLTVIGDEKLKLQEIFYLAMAIHDPLKWLEDQGFLAFLKKHLEDKEWKTSWSCDNVNAQVLAWLESFVKWLESMPERPKPGGNNGNCLYK